MDTQLFSGSMDETAIDLPSGSTMDFLRPSPDSIDIREIGYLLGGCYRYNGRFGHYSVLSHTMAVAGKVSSKFEDAMPLFRARAVLHALLHDAPEAYTGDLPNPLKVALRKLDNESMSTFDHIEHRILLAIYDHLGMPVPSPHVVEAVTEVDHHIYAVERIAFVGNTPWESEEDSAARRAFVQSSYIDPEMYPKAVQRACDLLKMELETSENPAA